MNPIFCRFSISCFRLRPYLSCFIKCVNITLLLVSFSLINLRAQVNSDPTVEFKKLAAQLSTARLDGAAESEASQEAALAILDKLTIAALNSSAPPDLDALNRRMADLTSHVPPVGENYRLARLGGNSAAYALVVNFGLSGPAAVRIYSNSSGHYALTARIDHFADKDFFDSDIEFISMSAADPIFVIVAGRTDDLATGMFTAWRFDGRRAVPLWTSDLLQQSSYEADGDAFRLIYCSEPDEDHPAVCRKMTRDVYRLQAGEWKRTESKEVIPAKVPPK
jgi:hypothetical protein